VEVPDVGIEINWGGARVAFQAIPKDDDGSGNYLRKDTFVNASLSVSPAGLATFTYDGNTISANLAGYSSLTLNQINFGGRTGGANDNQWIDDLNVTGFLPGSSAAEANQTVKFLVSNDNPSLFSTQPAVSNDGTLTYTPAPNKCGMATITVIAMDDGGTACNGSDMSAPCVFKITINCLPDCPIAYGTNVVVVQGGSLTFPLPASDPDGDPLTCMVTVPPIHGSVVVNSATCVATYTPNAGYLGPDSFKWKASDGTCDSNEAEVGITVRVLNQPPVCVARVAPDACVLRFPNDANLYVVSLDGQQGCVVLDGSGSSDPDGDALHYGWTVDGFHVAMDAAQEPSGTGTGTGTGSVSLSGNTLTISIAFSGLSANANNAHIHGPAAPGVNAGVLYPLNAITTLGATAGTINGTVTLVEGTGGFSIAQQLQQLCAGLWYINIHTPNNPGGEIRGQIQPGALEGAIVTACMGLGCHTITLCVSDGLAASACDLRVCVISAGEAVEQCVTLVDNADLGRKNKRPLLATLKAAAAAFDRGDFTPALNQLEAFQNKVQAQIARDNPAAAAAFIECAQKIIDAIDCAAALANGQ
jgi:CHRD domain/Bacterial Ig domain